jgi:hypothetical protein
VFDTVDEVVTVAVTGRTFFSNIVVKTREENPVDTTTYAATESCCATKTFTPSRNRLTTNKFIRQNNELIE